MVVFFVWMQKKNPKTKQYTSLLKGSTKGEWHKLRFSSFTRNAKKYIPFQISVHIHQLPPLTEASRGGTADLRLQSQYVFIALQQLKEAHAAKIAFGKTS